MQNDRRQDVCWQNDFGQNASVQKAADKMFVVKMTVNTMYEENMCLGILYIYKMALQK